MYMCNAQYLPVKLSVLIAHLREMHIFGSFHDPHHLTLVIKKNCFSYRHNDL